MTENLDSENGIDIVVETRYLSQQSDPVNNSFAFAYTITITNNRDEPVKLLERHWIITDKDDHVDEIRGKGVIGKQPVIEPGGSFRYSSGAVLATDIGDMKGSYTMKTPSGETFEATIPAFVLALPNTLH